MRFNGHNAGLWCPFENWHMGNGGETVADVYKVTRDQQDQYWRLSWSEARPFTSFPAHINVQGDLSLSSSENSKHLTRISYENTSFKTAKILMGY